MTTPVKNPTVKEVSFDIRFKLKDEISYDKIGDYLLRQFSKTYSKSRLTKEGEMLPPDFPFPVVMKQFLTKDEKRLVGIGNGILTVHTVEHNRFEKFRPEIKIMLKFLDDLGLKDGISRVGLRYIDEFKSPSKKVLHKSIEFPIKGFSEKGKNALFIMESEEDILNLRIIESADKPGVFFLDTDLYNKKKKDLNMVLPWLDKAHKKLYSAFESAINPEYFKSQIK